MNDVDRKIDFLLSPQGQKIMKKQKKLSTKKKRKEQLKRAFIFILKNLLIPVLAVIISTLILKYF